MPRSKATTARRNSLRSSKGTNSKKSGLNRKNAKQNKNRPASRTPKKSKKEKKTKTKTTVTKSSREDISKAIKKLAAERKVKIFEVTQDNAADIHAELRKKGHARELTQGKVRTEFIYNYFSCKYGSYLTGSTQIDGSKPADKEYSSKFKKSNFWWNGLKIYALRQKTGDKLVVGFVVMHNAYLSMYPGPDEDHYDVDPKMMAGDRDIAEEIGGDERMGSKTWADVPILCGSGHGDLLIALALAYCGMEKMIVSVATGEENQRMQSLLTKWQFSKLVMTHPNTEESWQDEDGDPSFVMYREGPITVDEIKDRLKEGKQGTEKEKKKTESKVKKTTESTRSSSDVIRVLSTTKKIQQIRMKNKEKVEKIKSNHADAMKKKDTILEKLKKQLKEKDAVISELKSKNKTLSKSVKAKKSKIITMIRKALNEVRISPCVAWKKTK
ncbi:hypothetical protein AAMO2058_001699400 [Amorphochlora amoebiformis]